MNLTADVFPKLRLRNRKLDKCLRSPLSEDPSTGNIANWLESERQPLYHKGIFPRSFLWKNALLVICKIVRLFVNTLSATDKDYLPNKDNLTQPIQMQVYRKEKFFTFFLFFF